MQDCSTCIYSKPGDCKHPKNTSLEFWNRKGTDPCLYYMKKEVLLQENPPDDTISIIKKTLLDT